MPPRVLTSPFWPRPFGSNRAYGPTLGREAREKLWLESVELLRFELAHLDAEQITLCTGHRKIELGEDGWPSESLSNAVTGHPGVQIAFRCEYGWMHFLCDAFAQWEINFRSLGEALQGLNGMNLLQLLPDGAVYAPFRVPQNPFGTGREARETEDAATDSHHHIPSTVPDLVVIAGTWIAARSSVSLSTLLLSEDGLKRAYREAARKLHPDVETGDHAAFVQLGKYVAVVENYQKTQNREPFG